MNKKINEQINEKLEALKENDRQPVWLTVKGACKAFGIGRTKMYELIEKRLVKHTRIKDKHQVRGRVLINYESLNSLLEGWATEAENQTAK